jgi:hypothetical protein
LLLGSKEEYKGFNAELGKSRLCDVGLGKTGTGKYTWTRDQQINWLEMEEKWFVELWAKGEENSKKAGLGPDKKWNRSVSILSCPLSLAWKWKTVGDIQRCWLWSQLFIYYKEAEMREERRREWKMKVDEGLTPQALKLWMEKYDAMVTKALLNRCVVSPFDEYALHEDQEDDDESPYFMPKPAEGDSEVGHCAGMRTAAQKAKGQELINLVKAERMAEAENEAEYVRILSTC